MDNLTLDLSRSTFANNSAALDGGVVYLRGLDSYSVLVTDSAFEDNTCGKYGDNIFAKPRLPATQAEVAPPTRRLNEAKPAYSDDVRKLVIASTSFSTPNYHNQLYFENVSNLEISNVTFGNVSNSLAIEGGSMYLLNCVNVSVSSSTFVGQSAFIRGGAIFANQSEVGPGLVDFHTQTSEGQLRSALF